MAASAIPNLTLGIFATAALGQFQAVTVGGVIATAAGNAVGFTQTSGVIGDRVPVTAGGTAIATASAAIAVGAAVEVVGAAGQVVTRTAGVTVGRALTAASAAGDQIEVLVIAN